ncbi:MAG TPA: vWA domain-containing protein, partial [Gemmatimonadaceae bacterium]|nr:vWA domain-containing protein [Gemmatimonadaceae bacterium]
MPSLESAFQLLFKYRPAVFAEGQLAFGIAGPLAIGLAVAALVVATAVVTYGRVGAHSTGRDRLVLAAIRTAVLLVVVVCLFRPMLLISAPVPQRNFVGVLIDDSRSMQIADNGQSRADVVRAAMGSGDSSLIAGLREKFQVRLFRFGTALERIEAISSLGFEGVETRVGDAIASARQELDAVPLSGLIVLSDGADNASQAVADELQSLRARSVPVFAVGLGAERFDRDAEIERVELPRQVLEGTSFVASVVIRQRGFEGDKVPMVVEENGKVIAQEEIELPPD